MGALVLGARGRGPARQSRSRLTRERLLRAGMRLADRGDFDATSIATFAKAAGCSVGAFYHHFADKEAFYRELVAASLEALWPRFQQEFAAERLRDLDAAALVRHAVAFVRAVVRDHQGLLRVTLRRSLEERAAWQPVRQFARAYEARVAELLSARREEMGHADWRRGFRNGMQMVYGTLLNAVINRPGPLLIEEDAIVDELTLMLHRYLQIETPEPS